MISNSQKQNRSVHVAMIIIAVVAVLGVLGYVAWDNFFASKNQPVKANETTTNSGNDNSREETTYKTVKINNYTFQYPVNENNNKVIIILDDSTSALNISFIPLRSYFADKDVSDDCRNYVAGLVNAYTEKEIIDYSYLSRIYNKSTLKDAQDDGTLVQVGSSDLYVGGPFKHNELCSDIYENKDPVLKNVLSEVSTIRLNWLKSLELTQ